MPIFDQGYQHWSGAVSGHAWRWLTIARHGVKAQLKGRVLKLLLLGAWVPAIALVVALALWGLLEQQTESVLAFLRNVLPPDVIAKPAEYRGAVWTIAYSFFFKAELTAALFLVTVVGPNLISRDLRFNALPLYFSRPLRRGDYFLGKLGVIGFYLLATLAGPAVAAYLMGVAFSLNLGVLRDTHRLLWAGLAYAAVITASAGTLMLALSSLSRRSIYVGIAWAAFCFFSMTVSGILIGIRYDAEQGRMRNDGLSEWLAKNPPPPGVEMRGNRAIVHGTAAPKKGLFGGLIEDDRQRWYRQYRETRQRLDAESDAAVARDLRHDWRPLISYPTNLDRIGDWLLDADAAWVTLGRTFERQRASMAPAIALKAGGRLPKELTAPANDRLLADQMVWQFPWQWSAGVLAGLWLLSVFILTRRVRSLDRLK
jgi:hypothetical protein